jgi:hypothetical protein
MEEIRKFAKNQAWLRQIVEKARTGYRNKKLESDENKITRDQFTAVYHLLF